MFLQLVIIKERCEDTSDPFKVSHRGTVEEDFTDLYRSVLRMIAAL